ncbi:TetR/AcrR family transcriptional regulator [Hyphomicrobium sp.]|uniref:TetR/AcrR family transcriptional regulator n=1 Tax=Hyphomicrobium sp. TaxID=82 RepID=UPI000FA2C897|nr:TetR/AcrR family transcriptional regulator [Hyphomicrobium sp.]RUP11072.1 MAG: TetR/AcrR family transcriptional regulator [Hyphomicrobium sp.]
MRSAGESEANSEERLAAKSPRERILIAARDLFYRHGVHAVGVETIAETALTNKMTLYRHFRSKDDLIVVYAQQLANEGDEVLDRILSENLANPQKQVDAWVDHVEDVLTNKLERGCALANAAVELDTGHPARAVIEAYKQRKHDRLVGLFRAARYRDPNLLADEVFLLFEGARISIQCGGKGPALRVVGMLRGLLASRPKSA